MTSTAMPATDTNTPDTVIAEDAPLGVLLWPVRAPEYAPSYTLRSVATVRTETGGFVVWTYQNGGTRTFRSGERIAVRLPA